MVNGKSWLSIQNLESNDYSPFTIYHSRPFCHQLVLPPAFVDGCLRLAEQELRRVGVALLKHPVARLGVDVVLQGNLRVARNELERVLSFDGARRVEAVERPTARLDRELLLAHPQRHVNAVRDALAVGDDERRAVVRLRFEESLDRVRVTRAHCYLRYVDVAVLRGHHAEVFLRRRLTACRE